MTESDQRDDPTPPSAFRVLDALPDAVAVLDADLVIQHLNAHFRTLVGSDPIATRFAIGRRYLECRSSAIGPGTQDEVALEEALTGKRSERAGTGAWARVFDTQVLPFVEGDRSLLLVVKQDMTDRRLAEAAQVRYHAVLEAVGFAAAKFLGMHDWEESVGAVLERLGRTTDVSRVYIFEMFTGEDGALRASQRYEWVAKGVVPQIDNPDLQDMAPAALGLGRWLELLSRNDCVHGLVRDFPADERAFLEPQDIVAIAVVPIMVDDIWWGLIGIDECRRGRPWSAVELEALRAAAGLFGAAIQHQRARAAMRQSLAQETRIRAQEDALLQLSTPLIPVHDDVVVMPLVGALDQKRAERVLETLLSGIVERSARAAILDVTGIPRLDAEVADALLRVARAARLLGAEVMLSGIRPEVARTLIGLGADFGGIATTASLKAAIALALKRVSRR
jgi:anti-anti-sigma regulatory factor